MRFDRLCKIMRRTGWLKAFCLFIVGFALLGTAITSADSGVLIAIDVGVPDEKVLSLETMKVDIKIDNQHAFVRVEQVFKSHVDRVLEGNYKFDLPENATVADFAVWDGLTRIPAAIMERRRAEEVYERIKRPQEIDPGLLTKDDEQGGDTLFNVKVTPIPAYGNKRLELEYTEMLPIDGLAAIFTFPFQPISGFAQRVNNLSIKLHILSELPIGPPTLLSKAYPLTFQKADAHEIEAEFQTKNIELNEDLVFSYPIVIPETTLGFITYRAPERVSAYDMRDPALSKKDPDGYFQATVNYNLTGRSAEQRTAGNNRNEQQKPRQILLLLDNSLSMNGKKIVRAYEAIDFFLHRLNASDSFNVILFNEYPTAFAAQPQPATMENIEQALGFVRNSPLEGGTDILSALKLALEQVEQTSQIDSINRSIVLITDGNPTLGAITTKQIVADFDRLNHSGNKPLVQLYSFGLGGDVRQQLLAELVAKCQGYFVQYRETEDLSGRLGLFLDKVGEQGITDVAFQAEEAKNFYYVYPVFSAFNNRSFDGANLAYVGRYRQPRSQETISIVGKFENQVVKFNKQVTLPEFDNLHTQLPRLWARARVDALLHEIDLNGEREDLINEIINLSQKYKFVTPYTAFIAAPRALLRPRVIQPGDPVIRVRTDRSIVSVLAVLPFGFTLPLEYLTEEDVWEARFIAPKNVPDGTYRFRLILTDKQGNGYQEEKTLVIDSHPPTLNVKVDKQVRAGEVLKIAVNADRDTAMLTARFYGAQPVHLQWSAAEKHSLGTLFIPRDLPSGKYTLVVAGEDFAHNNSTAEVDVEVIGN
ncbi:MAG: VIT domain-containing protein [Acidobacteriota bacterium]